MQIAARSLHRLPGAGVWDAFNIPGYITWAAVAVHPLLHLAQGSLKTPYPLLGLLGLVGMLLLFVVRAQMDARNAALGPRRAVILGQALAALLACWVFRDNLTPALLVIVAAQMSVVFPPRGVVALLLAINAALALVPFHFDDFGEFVALLIAYGGFQAFAAVGAHYALRIFEGREDALRINA